MKHRFFWLIFLFTLTTLPSSAALAKDVPTSWLDSLQANLWRMDADSLGYSYRMLSVQNKLDKHGNIKSSDTSRVCAVFDESGNRVLQELSSEGEVVKTRPLPKDEESGDQSGEEKGKDEKEDKEDREMNLSMNPFASFAPENRGDFIFSMLKDSDDGYPRFSVRPREGKVGFIGEFTVDTTHWAPLYVQGHPSKPPKHVNSLDMKMSFKPNGNGTNFICSAITKVDASFLLLKFRMKIEQTFSDYQLVR